MNALRLIVIFGSLVYGCSLRVFAVVSTGRKSTPFASKIFAEEGKLLRAIIKVKPSTPNELNRIDVDSSITIENLDNFLMVLHRRERSSICMDLVTCK